MTPNSLLVKVMFSAMSTAFGASSSLVFEPRADKARRPLLRFLRHLTTIIAPSLLLGVSLAPPEACAAPPKGPAHAQRELDDRNSLLLSLSFTTREPNALGVRRLAQTSSTATTRLLLTWAAGPEITQSPLMRLEMIRALDARSSGSERERVVGALMRLFESPALPPTRPTRTRHDRESSAARPLSQFSRGSAALALARSQHPRALRLLVVTAAQGVDQDPIGSSLAREALTAAPPLVSVEKKLKLHLSPALIAHALRNDPSISAPDSKNPAQLLEWRKSPIKWAEELRLLGGPNSLPAPFKNTDNWKLSLAQNPLWTFRALAVLSGVLPKNVHDFALQSVDEFISDQADAIRLEAAWALSNLAPVQASLLFSSTEDLAVKEGLLRQASSGPLAQAAFQWATSGANTQLVQGPSSELAEMALSSSLWATPNWSKISDSELWKVNQNPSTGVVAIAPLASRLQDPARHAPGTSLEQVQGWLEHRNSMIRGAAAHGLAYSPSSTAAGLLLAAYRTEPDVQVRRKIVRSLFLHSRVSPEARRHIWRLDPDSDCRMLARGKRTLGERHFFIDQRRPGSRHLFDNQPLQLNLKSASDGFVGVVFTSD